MIIKIGIIGSGFGMYGLLPAFGRIEDCRVVAICGKESKRLIDTTQRYGVDKIYSDWKLMLEVEALDAICIAVVPSKQFEIIEYAFEKNIGVFAEKPLSISYEQTLALMGLANKRKLPNMVDFIFPEIPEWKKTKELLVSNAIGKVFHVSVNWCFMSYDLKHGVKSWKSNEAEGGGALSFYVSHVFYYLEFFLGAIRSVISQAVASGKSLNGGNSAVDLLLQFENGTIGTISFNCSYLGSKEHVIKFSGETGSIKLSNLSDNVIRNFTLEYYNNYGENTQLLMPPMDFPEGEDERIPAIVEIGKRFVSWCKYGTRMEPSFEQGVSVQRVIELAQKNVFSQNQL